MTANLIRERAGNAPFVQPYLHALDRMQKRAFLHPEQVVARARTLLDERLGTSAHPAEAVFAPAGAGIPAEHTHYFDGFALLLMLPLGTAVAVRRAEGPASQVAFEGSEATWHFDRAGAAGEAPGWPAWARLVEQLVRRLVPEGVQVEVAVASTMHASCMDAYLAALGVATVRALQAAFALPADTPAVLGVVRDVVAETLQMPFGVAYLLAADTGSTDTFVLVDTATLERIPLDAPGRDVLGWGFVDAAVGPARDAAFFRSRKETTDEAVAVLRRKAFPGLASLRDVEHRDLHAALEALPRRLRPVVRHLVTENRRVQKMVVAIRQRDWQMLGALLLMSHASARSDWDGPREAVDLVVEQVEQMSIEGMYGACTTGRGGCVLVVGQPFIVPRCLDRITGALQARLGLASDVMLL